MQDKLSVFVLSNNPGLRKLVSLFLAEIDEFEFVHENLDNSDLFNAVSSLPYALLLIDMNEDFSIQLKQIATDCPNCKIVAIKDFPDVKFIVNVIGLGAKDVLASPLIKSDFFRTIKRMRDELLSQNSNPDGKCKIISVFSNKGGIGKTCIATNLAYELAQNTKDKVALIDLNFQTGDVTTFMGIEPTYDLAYIFENMKIFNNDLVESLMCNYNETSLFVFSNPPNFEQGYEVSSETLKKFFNAVKQNFSYIVVDLDSAFDKKNIFTMEMSDFVLLVTIVNLPAVRNCRRCLDMFDKLGFDDSKIQVLINRYMENDEISADDVAEFLDKRIYKKLPNNYFAVMNAINKGKTVSELNPGSNIAQSYRQLATLVADSVFRDRSRSKFEDSRFTHYLGN